jgi:hypothetical protein
MGRHGAKRRAAENNPNIVAVLPYFKAHGGHLIRVVTGFIHVKEGFCTDKSVWGRNKVEIRLDQTYALGCCDGMYNDHRGLER